MLPDLRAEPVFSDGHRKEELQIRERLHFNQSEVLTTPVYRYCDCVRCEHIRRAGWAQKLVSERARLHTPRAAHKKRGFLPWARCVVCCITIVVMTWPVSSNTRQVWGRPVSSNLVRADVHLLYRISPSPLASAEYGLPAYEVASTRENGKKMRRLGCTWLR